MKNCMWFWTASPHAWMGRRLCRPNYDLTQDFREARLKLNMLRRGGEELETNEEVDNEREEDVARKRKG